MNNYWKASFGVLLVFICGWLAGMLCTTLFLGTKRADFQKHGQVAVAELLERKTTRNLHLDPQQQEQIHALIVKNLQERKRLQIQIQPQVQLLNWQMFQQIDALLHPDQKDRFHLNVEALRKRAERNAMNSGGMNPFPASAPAESSPGK